jgi:hypothetical protein
LRLLLVFWLFFFGIVAETLAADTVYTYYPNGSLKSEQTVEQGNIISEMVYLENGSRKHKWDLQKNTVYSYNSFEAYSDSSAAYFLERSPSYTIYQYFGDSPNLFYIERYQDINRHGKAQYFHRNGELKAEGNFDIGKKVGFWTYGTEDGSRDIHWHIINHGYYEKGISVYNTIFPFVLTLSLLFVVGYRFSKRGRYPSYYKMVAILPFALFFLWVILVGVLHEEASLLLKRMFGDGFFVVLETATAVMVLLSLFNAIWARRTMVKRKTSLLFLFVGLLFSVFMLWLRFVEAMTAVRVL